MNYRTFYNRPNVFITKISEFSFIFFGRFGISEWRELVLRVNIACVYIPDRNEPYQRANVTVAEMLETLCLVRVVARECIKFLNSLPVSGRVYVHTATVNGTFYEKCFRYFLSII